MFEVVKGRTPRYRRHAYVFVGLIPFWLLAVWSMQWFAQGAAEALRQQSLFVFGAFFFFTVDFVTACVFKIMIRGEESFGSTGLASGAKKLALWIVIGGGSTVWANTFPGDPEQVRWFDPRWLAANLDLLAFLYMYGIDLVSSVENIFGKPIGETRIGRFFRAVTGMFFPNIEGTLESMEEGKDG